MGAPHQVVVRLIAIFLKPSGYPLSCLYNFGTTLIPFASVGSQLFCANNSNVVAKIIRQGAITRAEYVFDDQCILMIFSCTHRILTTISPQYPKPTVNQGNALKRCLMRSSKKLKFRLHLLGACGISACGNKQRVNCKR